MKSIGWVLLLFALMAFVLAPVRAQEDEDIVSEEAEDDTTTTPEEEYEDDLDAHEISTSYLIPEYTDKSLPIGEPVTVLVDFTNNGEDVFNVTHVGAFLHSPFDLNYFIQNFTAKETSGVAAPGGQISLEYTFTPDKKLEALEFWLSGFVQYTVEGSDEPYQQVFVNTTITLFDKKGGFDFNRMFTNMLMMATLCAGGYFGFEYFTSKAGGKKKKRAYKPAPVAAVSADDDDEWTVNAYKQSDKSKKAGGSNNRRKISKK